MSLEHHETLIAAWMRTLPRTRAEPVRVGIEEGKRISPDVPRDAVWHTGAYYRQTRDTPKNTRAWSEGERTYEQRGYYLLGALPVSYEERELDTERPPVLYVAPAPRTLYYVASFYEGAIDERFHPFGACFQLFPWGAREPEGTSTTIEVHMQVLAHPHPRPTG